MYTAPYLLGKPKRVASIFNTNCAPTPVDDNAVSVVEFENNAIAVLETSFISPYQSDDFELLGTEGAIIQMDGKVRVRSNKIKDGWFIPDRLPEQMPMAMRLWFDGIEKGAEIPFDLDRALALTEMLENAYISDREQKIKAVI
jgi:predicted dehydrogenase